MMKVLLPFTDQSETAENRARNSTLSKAISVVPGNGAVIQSYVRKANKLEILRLTQAFRWLVFPKIATPCLTSNVQRRTLNVQCGNAYGEALLNGFIFPHSTLEVGRSAFDVHSSLLVQLGIQMRKLFLDGS